MSAVPHQTTQDNGVVTIPGPAGDLEAAVTLPAAGASPRGIAIVCHPHPLFGGTMRNKVATTLARVFAGRGAVAVRFNFRGVGKSDGTFAQGMGECEDLVAVVRWARRRYADLPLHLAGFSFGAYIVAAMAAAHEVGPVASLTTVAPPVTHFDFDAFAPLSREVPWTVVQGGHDEVVSARAVSAWVRRMPRPPRLVRLVRAGHFFHGQLVALQEALAKGYL